MGYRLTIEPEQATGAWEVTVLVRLNRAETNDLFFAGDIMVSWPTEGLILDTSSLSAEPARIGASARVDDRSELYFRGLIDELAIFNRALSEQEVQTLFQLGLQGKPLVKATRTRSAR